MTVTNWIIEYRVKNLNILKLVTNAARPSFSKWITDEMFLWNDVNGDATLASASDNERPISEIFKALQSFAPSPHMPI